MGGHPVHPTLPLLARAGTDPSTRLLLVDGHNLLWGATFGFPAPIYSRDKTRLLTGLFAFFALLRVAIRDDVPGGAPEVIVVFDGEHGAAIRQQAHDGYKASRSGDEAALAPLRFLPDVKRGLDTCGIAWIELEHAEADDAIATLVQATPGSRQVIIMSRDQDYYQLVTNHVVVLNTRFRAGHKLVTPAEVYARHRVTPAQWADFRALSGDPADEIPGVQGIGAKTAADLLAGGLTLDDLPASGRLATGRGRTVAQQYDLALKWRNMIRLNTDLELPRLPTGAASPDLPRPADVVEQLGLW
jgi:DNA polymerase-1